MRAISASVAKNDLDGLIARVNEGHAPVAITGTKGKCAVLVGEEDWASIAETLALGSVSGIPASLERGAKEPTNACVDERTLG